MANPATLYRFKIDVSDIDRSIYEEINFRAAMHPSESENFLLTRVIAYVLNYEPELKMSSGLPSADEPAIHLLGKNGNIAKWIDIGNPSARRLHKASKAAQTVLVYTYKDPQNIQKNAEGEVIHRAKEILIYALDEKFLKKLALKLSRNNTWSFIHDGGEISISIGDDCLATSLEVRHLQ